MAQHIPLPETADEAKIRTAEYILKVLRWQDKARALTDAELSTAVIDKVWARMASVEGIELLDEMISRFEKAKGIVRDENGEIVK